MTEKPLLWKAGMGYTHMRQRKADDVVGTIYCRCGCGQIVPASEANWGVRYYSTAHQNKAQAERAKLRYQRKAKDV